MIQYDLVENKHMDLNLIVYIVKRLDHRDDPTVDPQGTLKGPTCLKCGFVH